MRRFVQIKQPQISPQAAAVVNNDTTYFPVFLHTAIDQNRPVGPRRTFSEHKHDFYHIVLYTGRSQYSLGGNFFEAEPGTCVLVNPQQPHDFVSRWENAVYSEVTFAYRSKIGEPLRIPFEELFSLFFGRATSLPQAPLLSMDQTRILRNFFLTLTDHLNSTNSFAPYHAQHCLALIFNYFARTVITKEELVQQSRFDPARIYIEEHYFEEVSIDKLAQIIGVSKGYFFRGFKKEFGISPITMQHRLRIKAAKTLLQATTLQCNEVGFRIGFSDSHFFHRVFKKQTGVTPGQYRKLNAE